MFGDIKEYLSKLPLNILSVLPFEKLDKYLFRFQCKKYNTFSVNLQILDILILVPFAHPPKKNKTIIKDSVQRILRRGLSFFLFFTFVMKKRYHKCCINLVHFSSLRLIGKLYIITTINSSIIYYEMYIDLKRFSQNV